MRLTSEDGKLVLSESYVEKFEEDIEHMVDTLAESEPSLSSGGVFGDGVFSLAKTLPEKDEVN
jgi:hypothetical protein